MGFEDAEAFVRYTQGADDEKYTLLPPEAIPPIPSSYQRILPPPVEYQRTLPPPLEYPSSYRRAQYNDDIPRIQSQNPLMDDYAVPRQLFSSRQTLDAVDDDDIAWPSENDPEFILFLERHYLNTKADDTNGRD